MILYHKHRLIVQLDLFSKEKFYNEQKIKFQAIQILKFMDKRKVWHSDIITKTRFKNLLFMTSIIFFFSCCFTINEQIYVSNKIETMTITMSLSKRCFKFLFSLIEFMNPRRMTNDFHPFIFRLYNYPPIMNISYFLFAIFLWTFRMSLLAIYYTSYHCYI